jgi:K+/H+ antiporter YhaU regulatory subunit KhtT
VVRNGKAHTNPGPDFRIEAGDVLVLLGTHAQLAEAKKHLAGVHAP